MTPATDQRIRRATEADLAALIALEQRCFTLDRQSPRSLAYLLRHAHASTLIANRGGAVTAALTLLFRRGSRVARIYSIAVDPAARGQGMGTTLLCRAEAEALGQGCDRMRCEIRIDNHASLALFTIAGYVELARSPGYYDDGTTALRLQKRLHCRTPSD